MEQTIRDLIAKGKTAKAIAKLRHHTTSDDDLKNEMDILSARFSRYQTQLHLGLEAPSVLNIELNQIHQALLAVVNPNASERVT